MINNNWITIFSFKEFVDYFSGNELVQLSMSCKKFRKCLTPVAFKSFNFNSFIDTQNYKSYSIAEDDGEFQNNEEEDDITYIRNPYKPLTSKFTENENRFKLDLKQYPGQPKLFSLKHLNDYHYFLNYIPNLFTKLTSLFISKSHLQIETLQCIMINLKYLSSLELHYNDLLQYSENLSQTPIDWPISLKELKLYNNYVVYVENKKNPLKVKLDLIVDLQIDFLQLNPKHLPKLTTLDYGLFIWQPDISDLTEFLKLNPQIKNLKIGGPTFYPQPFRAIKRIHSLESLSLNFSNYNMSESEFNDLPVFNTVTRLTISLGSDSENIDKIIEKLPNLNKLVVEMYNEAFDKLSTIATKYSRIKTLNLKVHLQYFNSKEINIPRLENLKDLEFILNLYNYFNHTNWNADSCPSLNRVKFSLDKHQDPFDLQKLNRKFDNWKLVYYPYKITLFKIRQ